MKDLENLIKNKSVDDKTRKTKKESLKCQLCDFETTSQRGLNVHKKRKHTNLQEDKYPAECDFCELQLNSESEMKMHLKITHTFGETKFKCEDCDYCGENELSVEVHQGKCHTEDFECGLCEYKAGTIENLDTHLSTCESYECDDCFFRVGNLADIKSHMIGKHGKENLKIIHGKVDRKNINFIKTTEHLRFDLFA